MAKAFANDGDKNDTIVQETAVRETVVRQRKTGRNPLTWWASRSSDQAFVSVDAGYSSSLHSSSSSDLETNGRSAKSNVFQDPTAAELYKPVGKYEGLHRFDPKATWTAEEESRLVTKLPSQLISKKLGPDNWIPIQMISWSIVAASQARLTGRTSFYICRFLLGLIEGGFIPDVILYLSYFYKNNELPRRLSYFWSAYVVTTIIASFLAFGILHLRGHGSLHDGWRYLFAIEGALTGIIGVISFFYLPPSPTQTKSHGWRGFLRSKEGWFSEREETIMVTRILLDDPGKATMHNRQALSPRLFWESLTDYDMWPIYLLGLTWTVPMTPETNYLTLTLKSLGFSTFHTNLLVIPSAVLFILQLLFWTWFSERFNQRFLVGLISQIWVLPLVIALEVLPARFPHAAWVRYAISSLIVGYPYAHAILVAITSRNSGTVRTRTVGSSLYNMAVQTSNIISSQIYRPADKPLYYRGNKILIGIAVWNIVAFTAAKFYYVWKNNQRDQLWDSMTREERLNYLATTKDKGNKRLDFRFAH
ncbi:hypothetical protein FH972_024016 [Carpinus fangiana]|uniref:Major facilitator superfamily (MFS) profile domain-containing protein n=1 Tax=Carpinus fangiana TaxID=176857 RepID=A0A5N6KWT8_9ROSI|nr:hypothetical protein FH972_024016 [Carpinus fangiana]